MSEFPPIFKNVEFSIDDIGEHMTHYARKNNLMRKPRRALTSSYYGIKILLPTPLIKWYLDSGLVVTRIYRAIEYVPRASFKKSLCIGVLLTRTVQRKLMAKHSSY